MVQRTVNIVEMAGSNSLVKISSYNMHGFYNGASMLADLCKSSMIVAIQEHWLRVDELNKFSFVHTDYDFHAVSGMSSALTKGIIRGRPLGGVGFLWHNSINVQFIGCDHSNRCSVVKCTLNNKVFILFNVYFPCFENTIVYKDEISSITGYIENVLNCQSFDEIMILDDTNFDAEF